MMANHDTRPQVPDEREIDWERALTLLPGDEDI
jgi:hypothetical protein